MKRLARLSAALLAGIVVFCVGLWTLIHLLGDREVLYAGKNESYWIEQAKQKDAFLPGETTYRTINQIIIPQLARTLLQDTNDSPLRIWLVNALNCLPGVNIYFSTAPTRRGNAALFLGQLGPAAQAAAPALLQAFKGTDPIVREPAAVALGKLQVDPPNTVPFLIACLDNPDLAEAAADGLGEYGALAKTAVPKLMVLAKTREKELRHAAFKALQAIDPGAVPPTAAP